MVQNPGKNSLDFSFDQFSSIARYCHRSMRFAIDCSVFAIALLQSTFVINLVDQVLPSTRFCLRSNFTS